MTQCFDSKIIDQIESSKSYQEIENYLNSDFSHIFPDDDSVDINILSFWRENQHSFPKLSRLALMICAIPASNTIIERLFSAAKNTVTEKRTRLDCDKINEILFLQKNLKNLKQLSNKNIARKRTLPISSSDTVSCEDPACTAPKVACIDVEDDVDDFNDDECCFD